MKHNSKIIVCGWWFDKFDNQENQTDFIEQLKFINDNNKNITFKTFGKSDKISLYHNPNSINDFNLKNSS